MDRLQIRCWIMAIRLLRAILMVTACGVETCKARDSQFEKNMSQIQMDCQHILTDLNITLN